MKNKDDKDEIMKSHLKALSILFVVITVNAFVLFVLYGFGCLSNFPGDTVTSFFGFKRIIFQGVLNLFVFALIYLEADDYKKDKIIAYIKNFIEE